MTQLPHDEPAEHASAAEDLVRFFRALRPEARRDYEALAKRDQDFGENVTAERASTVKDGA
ncbi:MAG: hypothetical protein JWP97_2863 [Labilithrix sp.]|nr:hypothetical protein [Labilithrix sp.]